MADRKNVLSSILGFDPKVEISNLDSPPFDELYISFEIKSRRKNGSPRPILAPNERLKKVQRALLKKILIHVPPHPAATAFFAGRSIASNALQHHGCNYLYKTDIKEFFPSIRVNDVLNVLEKRFPHLSRAAIDEIVELTMHNGALPQGAPTSPHLANLFLFYFDEQLSKLCERIGARYTRYADDIAVSAQDMDALCIVDGVVRSGLSELGLTQNLDKTHFWGPNVRKIVTGLDVSGDTIRPPRKYRKKSAALVRMCEKYPSRITHSNFSRIMGYLLHWRGVAPDDLELKELMRRFKKLKPTQASEIV